MENEKKLEQLKKIEALMNGDFVKTDDFIKIHKGLLELAQSGDKTLDDKINAVIEATKNDVTGIKEKQDEFETKHDDLEEYVDGQIEKFEAALEKVKIIKGEKGDAPTRDELISIIQPLMPKAVDEDAMVSKVISRIPQPKENPNLPEEMSAEEIVEKLSSLPADKRLDKNFIRGYETFATQMELDYAISKLRNQVSYLVNAVEDIKTNGTGGGGAGNPSLPLNSFQYNKAGTFWGDKFAIRDPITHDTNIGKAYGTTQTVQFEIEDNFFGFGIKGAGITNNDTAAGASGFTSGDFTSVGLSTITGGWVSFANTGEQAIAIFDALNNININYTDASNNQAGIGLNGSNARIQYSDNSGNGSYLNLSTSGVAVGFNGNLIGFLPIADGSNGQVITTDGSNNWTFQNAGGGGITGTGANTQITRWTGTSTVAGDANLTYDPTTKIFWAGDHTGAFDNFKVDGSSHITTSQTDQFFIQTRSFSNYAFQVNASAAPSAFIGAVSGQGFKTLITLSDFSKLIIFANDGETRMTDTSGSVIGLFRANSNNPQIELGSATSSFKTQLIVSDAASSVFANAAIGFYVQDTTITPIKWLDVQTNNHAVVTGDTGNGFNKTKHLVDDINQQIVNTTDGAFHVKDTLGNTWFYVQPTANFLVKSGDVSNSNFGTLTELSDQATTQHFAITAAFKLMSRVGFNSSTVLGVKDTIAMVDTFTALGAVTVTLPNVSLANGQIIVVKDVGLNASINNVIVVAASGSVEAGLINTNGGSLIYYADNSTITWRLIGKV